jgi:hypothetical protein
MSLKPSISFLILVPVTVNFYHTYDSNTVEQEVAVFYIKMVQAVACYLDELQLHSFPGVVPRDISTVIDPIVLVVEFKKYF